VFGGIWNGVGTYWGKNGGGKGGQEGVEGGIGGKKFFPALARKEKKKRRKGERGGTQGQMDGGSSATHVGKKGGMGSNRGSAGRHPWRGWEKKGAKSVAVLRNRSLSRVLGKRGGGKKQLKRLRSYRRSSPAFLFFSKHEKKRRGKERDPVPSTMRPLPAKAAGKRKGGEGNQHW